MYSEQRLRKLLDMMNEQRRKVQKIEKVEDIKMCISSGNKKIGNVLNVSLPPILTCANCSQCKYLCYDAKACLQYPGAVLCARINNLVILQKDRDYYFAQIQKSIDLRKKNKFFRWHVAGDIIDYDYFERMIETARKNPDFIFWTYTKNYRIVNEWISNNGNTKEAIPANFSVMFSEWRGLPMENPYNLGEFRVVFKDEEKPEGFYCPGNCDVCTKCKRGCIANETTYCNEH